MREWIVIGALVGVLCASLAWSEEIKYRWSLVRKGGKEVNNTRATGTNDAAWFAGNWWGHKDPTNPGGAFRFQKGKFIPFTCPNIPEATKIEVADIESSSTIVGHLWVPNGQGGETLHAFLYKHGLATCDVIDVPGAFWTFLFRVNANRQVAVGYFYTDGQGTFWGAGVYDWATKQVTPVTIDGAADLVIRGINNHGELVGSYTLLDPTDPCLCMFWDNGFYRSADGQIVHLTTPNGGPIFPHAINDHGGHCQLVASRHDQWVGRHMTT
jgi:hypothetical protein